LPASRGSDAERRFAGELEAVLGGTDFVVETYAAWLEVSEADATHIDKITAITAARWPVALNAATQAAFSRVSDIREAHFEVRLERHAARSS
jgi:hypothetical protein